MKKLRNLLLTGILALMAIPAFSQGLANASVECQRSVAFYTDYIKVDNFRDAAPIWREALRECPPGVRQSIYVDGIRIFKYLIEQNKDNAQLKNSLIDSMLTMYDLRVEHFPKYAASASMFKVYDMLEYMGNEDQKILESIEKAMEISGDKTDPSLFVIAMQKMTSLYAKGSVTDKQVFDLYSRFSTIVDHQIASNNPDASKVKNDLDNLFVASGVANCENIVELFTPRFDANPDDKDLASTIVSLLSSAGCTTEPLFLRTVETLYNSDPTNYLYIRNLYLLYSAKGDQDNAIKMLEEAIASEQSNDTEDANMLITLANYHFQLENLSKAAETARLAMEKDATVSGRANLILGLVWASVRCTGNEIETRAKYWVAVDYLIRARNADPSLAQEANNYINSYSQYFPAQEEAFMFDIIDGASYTVNCGGMRATTTVRTRK
ncbi:MAG: tetratricopeptide repeat protein [Bacteroidales bacterium]|jgi:tetratricopeptide (TPR) repeat protein